MQTAITSSRLSGISSPICWSVNQPNLKPQNTALLLHDLLRHENDGFDIMPLSSSA
jgi:hypothetical protein